MEKWVQGTRREKQLGSRVVRLCVERLGAQGSFGKKDPDSAWCGSFQELPVPRQSRVDSHTSPSSGGYPFPPCCPLSVITAIA